MGSLRYAFGGDHPSQTTHQSMSPFHGLESKQIKGRISTAAPQILAYMLQSLRPILHINYPNSMLSYSKGSRGLFVPSRVIGIFTDTTISLSSRLRQRPDHYTIRAGRNLPDKEFRYLRTVIVTAAVYWDFNQELSPHHLIFQHRAGVTPYTSTFVLAECCVFIKQSQPPFFCNPFSLLAQASQDTRAYLIPKLRYKFAEFLLPSSLKRLRILISPTCVGLRYGLVRLKLRGFSWNHFQSLRGTRPLVSIPWITLPDLPSSLLRINNRDFQHPDDFPRSVPPSHLTTVQEY